MTRSFCMWCDVHPDEHTDLQAQFCQLIQDQWRVEALLRMSRGV